MKKRTRPNACWRIERIGKGQLVRLIAPLATQKGREKTMCIAIGSGKRMVDLIPILNGLDIKV